jgi:6-phosphogluconolactonase
MLLRSFPSLAFLSDAVARELAKIAKEAIAERGQFTIALSGGETPRTLYDILAKDYQSALDWKHVRFLWGDERYVRRDDPASNYRMAKESLFDHIPVTPDNVYPVNTALANPEKAAANYSTELSLTIGGSLPSFDLILLGLGNDGHTASLFPGTDFERMAGQLVVVTDSPVSPKVRISLTMDVINAARNVFFLVAGEEKKQILKAVLADEGNVDSKYPASRVNPRGQLTWFVDEAANG